MFDYIISKALGLHKMRMGWIRNNAVDKKILTEKIFNWQFSVELINSILTIFIITMKIPTNSKMN